MLYLPGFIFGTISFVLISALSDVKECFKSEILKPCICDSQLLSCTGNEKINLKSIFNKYSAAIDDDKKNQFKTFYLDNTAINELEEKTFENITFETIYINGASNLSRIHVNAFSGSSATIKLFEIANAPANIFLPDYNIFTSLNSMTNLEEIRIFGSKIVELPDDAFKQTTGPQKKLFRIMFTNSLLKIGKSPFQHLANLSELRLYNNKIDYISENAFYFLEESNSTLIIDLAFNKLNSSSFHVSAFNNMRRPVKLDITENKITFLDQHVFEPFLKQNNLNKIEINSIDCDDCRSFWLNNGQYSDSTLDGIICSNKEKVAHNKSFLKCKE